MYRFHSRAPRGLPAVGLLLMRVAVAVTIAGQRPVRQLDEDHFPVGRDSGYLWRANAFTKFVQRDGGVWVELETVGLSRRFPPFVGSNHRADCAPARAGEHRANAHRVSKRGSGDCAAPDFLTTVHSFSLCLSARRSSHRRDARGEGARVGGPRCQPRRACGIPREF